MYPQFGCGGGVSGAHIKRVPTPVPDTPPSSRPLPLCGDVRRCFRWAGRPRGRPLRVFRTPQRPPCVKGAVTAQAVTGGLSIPPTSLRSATSLKVNWPNGPREGGLGRYTREAFWCVPERGCGTPAQIRYRGHLIRHRLAAVPPSPQGEDGLCPVSVGVRQGGGATKIIPAAPPADVPWPAARCGRPAPGSPPALWRPCPG